MKWDSFRPNMFSRSKQYLDFLLSCILPNHSLLQLPGSDRHLYRKQYHHHHHHKHQRQEWATHNWESKCSRLAQLLKKKRIQKERSGANKKQYLNPENTFGLCFLLGSQSVATDNDTALEGLIWSPFWLLENNSEINSDLLKARFVLQTKPRLEYFLCQDFIKYFHLNLVNTLNRLLSPRWAQRVIPHLKTSIKNLKLLYERNKFYI